MKQSSQEPQIVSGLIWRTIDDDAVVVTPESGCVRVLNGVGTIIWQMLTEGKELPEILTYLVERYNISTSQAQDDLYAFLDELRARELIIWQP